jgi:hypothetical protein
VPITTKVVNLNPAHGDLYSIQHYVIKVVSDLRQVSGFSPGPLVSSSSKTDCHNITEILLKVTLNIITLSLLVDTLMLNIY